MSRFAKFLSNSSYAPIASSIILVNCVCECNNRKPKYYIHKSGRTSFVITHEKNKNTFGRVEEGLISDYKLDHLGIPRDIESYYYVIVDVESGNFHTEKRIIGETIYNYARKYFPNVDNDIVVLKNKNEIRPYTNYHTGDCKMHDVYRVNFYKFKKVCVLE